MMVAPLLWTLLLSLKHNADLVGHSGAALHPPYTLENYGAIFGNSLTLRWLLPPDAPIREMLQQRIREAEGTPP